MKNISRLFALALIALSVFAFVDMEEEKYPTLNIGDLAPKADLLMKDVKGKEISLSGVKKGNGLLVIFSCNTCPFVVGDGENSKGWETRYNGLFALCNRNDVGMILVNSNEAKRDKGDSFDDMQKRAKEKNYSSYYAMDKDSELANAFGAKTTPHVFLFDASLKLIYKGAIDDNVNDELKVTKRYLEDSIRAHVEGKEVSEKETKAIGCSIKRVK